MSRKLYSKMQPANIPIRAFPETPAKDAASDGSLSPKDRFTPLLAPFVRDRRMVRLLLGIVSLHLVLTAHGISLWQCPIKSSLGIPCPGCGLSRGIIFLIHGDLHASMAAHLFAPIFLAGFFMISVVGLLPTVFHQKTVHTIEMVEKRTGIVAFLLLSLLVYGTIRVF